MLRRHGYGVLALDLSGHGASEGVSNRLGWHGTRDVGAAIAYLRGRTEVKRIGGLGLSLGGEVLLGAASEYPELKAIVADGATQRCVAELLALPSERPLYRNWTARVMYTVVQLLSGQEPPRPLLDSNGRRPSPLPTCSLPAAATTRKWPLTRSLPKPPARGRRCGSRPAPRTPARWTAIPTSTSSA